MLYRNYLIGFGMVLLCAAMGLADDQSSKAPPLSPADSIATMKIQAGYSVVPVLTEPHIHEPAAVVWDGNGRMYVIEMRTYMQNIDGRNSLAPTSRISRHEDTNGDGVYDKHTVFADNLVLPRMVLPLLDRVIIRETNTLDLKSYQDTDDDGVADKVELWHAGGKRGGNLEHQPSGLVWNIDNWIYTTYSRHRYRFTGGNVVRAPLPHGSGQWGLTHDNEGRMFYSTAGGENPVMDFQRPIVYGKLSLDGEQAPGFRDVYPIDDVPDVQGGAKRLNPGGKLNKFTGCGGQSIYRGDAMPADFSGDLIIPEPVGRLIRRAKVTNDNGRIIVSNRYDQAEFIAASDPNFRPINSATGPDGCLYIVDMYRGIIQEANWVRKDSYLRGVVEDYELQKNIGRGRIFRVEHESTRRGPMPRMLDQTPGELIQYLTHGNGWWRSEAQKLIVLHGDKTVVGALEALVRDSQNPLGRLHALWTLEGLDAVSDSLLETGFADTDPMVRSAAVRIAEPRLKSNRAFDAALKRLASDTNPNVAIQTLLSVTHVEHPDVEKIVSSIYDAHPDNLWLRSLGDQLESQAIALRAERAKLEALRRQDKLLADSVVRGKAIYSTLCTTCHGGNGLGQPSPDRDNQMLAPPLNGSPRVVGHKERLNRILLHGLIGPVDGRVYADGLMLPMGANSDRWIADIANYIRNSWGNQASLIEATDVARIRSDTATHIGPWTLKTLKYYDPPVIENRAEWMLTSSHNAGKLNLAIDGIPKTRWDTGKFQSPGMWFAIELPEPVKILSINLDSQGSRQDYPRGFMVQVSDDGKQWSEPVAKGIGSKPVLEIEVDYPQPTRHIRVTQTGSVKNKYWSIHDVTIKGLTARSKPPVSMSETLAKLDTGSLIDQAIHQGNAVRGAKLFYDQSLACAKCHDPTRGNRLGPDLAEKRDGLSHAVLVDAVLEPSKEIRKDFLQSVVVTIDGLVVTGFLVSDDDENIVVREPNAGKDIEIPKDDIDDIKLSKVSAMPAGLVNQLETQEQFSDLIRFLMEVSEGGPEKLNSLKSLLEE